MNQNEIEEIKKMIQSGFDLELISFELDIPIEQVQKLKIDLSERTESNTRRTTYTGREMLEKINNEAHLKISKMRERYNQLYFRNNKTEIIKPKPLSQEEIELIDKIIINIEQKVKRMKKLSRKERKEEGYNIVAELRKIQDLQLPMKQAEQIYLLLCSEELKDLNTSIVDKVDYYLNIHRKKCASQYAKAIEFEQYEIEDIEVLKELEGKLTEKMVQENTMEVGAVKTKISSKILDIQKRKVLERMKNDIPTCIISIVQDLVDGNIDIQKANEIIDEEAQRRVESKPKTKFSLTKEQEKRQILMQIRTIIGEKTDRFHIPNAEATIMHLQNLCQIELGQAIGVVVKNLIGHKDFETAKSICNKFSEQNKYEDTKDRHNQYIKGIRNEIRNAEIANIVMTVINLNGTIEEEGAYISLIEKGIKMGNVNLKAISLGKSEDGLKDITLADIWNNPIQKEK